MDGSPDNDMREKDDDMVATGQDMADSYRYGSCEVSKIPEPNDEVSLTFLPCLTLAKMGLIARKLIAIEITEHLFENL